MKNQPFFRTYPLTIWNILTIIGYILLSTGLLYYYVYEPDPQRDYLLIYILATQMFLTSQYRAVRNLYMCLFWLLIGICHVVTAYFIKDILLFQFPAGHLSVPMANTFILVLVMQVIRYISLQLQGEEFVAPNRGGKDLFDERKPTWVDFLCTGIYFTVLFLGMFAMPKRPVEKPKSEYIIYLQRDSVK
ncbi:hypothetical protein ACLI1A_03285 [Flavobacterium sp. RHBU_3]|uniref:hypothetical protein n=1 Tax=Flavobacterium sp. RHBU_3 TaxID=3391184 RepID=UPI003985198D